MTVGLGLRGFVDAWRAATRESGDLIFERSLYHDMQALLSDLAPGARLTSWQKRSICELNACIQGEDLDVAAVRSCDSAVVERLISATTKNIGKHAQQELLDVVGSGVETMQRPLFRRRLADSIVRALFSPAENDRAAVRSLTRMLAELLAEAGSSRMLKEGALSVVSERFLLQRMDSLRRVINDEAAVDLLSSALGRLSDSLRPYAAFLVSRLGDAAEVASKAARQEAWSEREFSGRIGLFLAPRILTPGDLTPEIVSELAALSVSDRAAYIQASSASEFWQTLGQRWVRAIEEQVILIVVGRNLVRTMTQSACPPDREAEWAKTLALIFEESLQAWWQCCTLVSSALLDTGFFQDWHNDFEPPPRSVASATVETPQGPVEDPSAWDIFKHHLAADKLGAVISAGLEFGIAWACSRKCRLNLERSRRDAMTRRLVETVLTVVLSHGGRPTLEPATPRSDADAERVLSVQRSLAFRRAIGELAEEWFRVAMEGFLKAEGLIGADGSSALLIGLPDEVVRETQAYLLQRILGSFGEESLNYLNLDLVTLEQARDILSAFLAQFDSPSAYEVVGIVEGIDLEGQDLGFGAVRLYDARQWDYGEANLLDEYDLHTYRGPVEEYAPLPNTPLTHVTMSSTEYKGFYGSRSGQYVRHGARVYVPVEAFDPDMAREKAEMEIRSVLDSLNWPLVDHRGQGTASRLDLLPWFAVICRSHESASSTRKGGSPGLTRATITRDRIGQIIDAFRPLLGVSPELRTAIERRALRACYWLTRGYWETGCANRILSYWIALEQVIVETRMGKLPAIFNALPRMVGTWDRTGTGQEILRAWIKVTEDLDRLPRAVVALDADERFRGWRRVQTVLLSQLPSLEDLIAVSDLPSLQRLREVLRPTELDKKTEELQSRVSYRLRLIYQKRNAVVHEGLVYSPNLRCYADELWSMADHALLKIAGLVCSTPGKYHTIDEVIQHCDTRWWRP